MSFISTTVGKIKSLAITVNADILQGWYLLDLAFVQNDSQVGQYISLTTLVLSFKWVDSRIGILGLQHNSV